MSSFKEWCNQKCNNSMTNQEFVNVFVNKYLKLIYNKSTRVGCETRVLRPNINQAQLRHDILVMVYNMS